MPDRKIILVSDRVSPEAFLTLQGQDFLEVRRSKTPKLTPEEVADVNALFIRSQTPVTAELLAQAPNLQLIVSATSGFDHIDLPACEKWGITVMHTPWANVDTAAQLTWSLVLACIHKLIPAHAQIKAGNWERHRLESFELSGKTYGIVGLGRIGSKVADIAHAFGMNVIAYDPYCEEKNFTEAMAERVAFEECLKGADVVSFHVPLTRETFKMMNRSHFEYAHRGLVLVNTSRGPVVSEQDLCEALEKGWVAAAGLDVFEKEPLARTSQLLKLPNVVLTPHVGAVSKEAFAKASEQAVLKIIAFFRDGGTSDTLPPKAAWYGLDSMR